MYIILILFCSSCTFFRDDLARAIKKLHTLGSGFQIIPVGQNRIVQSVPGELNMDHTTVLQLAQVCVGMQNKKYCCSVPVLAPTAFIHKLLT